VRKRVVLIGITLSLMISLNACSVFGVGEAPAATAEPTAAATTVAAATATPIVLELDGPTMIGNGVSAAGEVTARNSAELVFRVPGVVSTVAVEAGDTVAAGDELIRLDNAELQLGVTQAEAALAQAQANYDRLVEGASEAEIAAVRAQVAQAAAGLRQVRGSVTDADIAAAEAALAQARARQADVVAGGSDAERTATQSAVEQARANLEIQRTNLSAAKTNAELQLSLAANGLRDAQQAYSERYWDNRDLETQLDKINRDLPQEAQDAEDQLKRAVESAEARLAQAQLAVEQSRRNEEEGLKAAEAQLRTAEAQFARIANGAPADATAAAAAAVAQAEAQLERLRGEQRAGAVAAAQAGLSGAQANLERLTADPSATALSAAAAAVAQAEAGLEAARLNLEKAVLRAPFAGTVARVNLDPGDLSTAAPFAVQVVDADNLRVEANISDTDIARVAVGQAVEIRIDALPETVLRGTVSFVAPTAISVGNIRTFPVRVDLESQEGLRAGMSVRIVIATE
jgi:multidrug resistance efflux pump